MRSWQLTESSETKEIAQFHEELPPRRRRRILDERDAARSVERDVVVTVGVADVDGRSGVQEVGREHVEREVFGAIEVDQGWVREHRVVVDDAADGELAVNW